MHTTRAETPAFQLEVYAGPGAESCPSRAEVLQSFAAGGGRLEGDYAISFGRLQERYRSTAFSAGRERVFDGSTCEEVSRAAIAALLVLADEERAPDHAISSAPRTQATTVEVEGLHEAQGGDDTHPWSASVEESAEKPTGSLLSLDLAPLHPLFGIARDAALGSTARLSYGGRHGWRISLLGQIVYPGERAAGRGRVSRDAVGLALDLCHPVLGVNARIHLCGFVAGYSVRAEALAFSENGSARQLRLSFGPAFDFDHSPSAPISFWFRGAFDIPILSEAFTVVGAGTDYVAPPLAGSLLAGARIRFL